MAVKKTKTLAEVTTVTTINTDQYIPVTDAYGNVTKVSLESLKSAIFGGIDINSINDGVYILFYIDSVKALAPVSSWKSLHSNDVAIGVAIVEAGRTIVVSTNDASFSLPWSSSSVNGGGTTTASRVTSNADLNGRSNTEAQITHQECAGADYAPGFCHLYSKYNATGQGHGEGLWWLPSLGEMMIIYKNLRKINYALSLIPGANILNGVYWTSTEKDKDIAYSFFLSSGNESSYIEYWAKKTDAKKVRPVTYY